MYPKQKEYICVYDMKQPKDEFDNNGLCVLEPSVCEITEELNGTYELYIEHPFDDFGKWKAIADHNIIKANGQLFRIVKVKKKLSRNGEKMQTATALHIFYDLNHNYLRNMVVYDTAHSMLEHIMTDWQIEPDDDFYNFDYLVDINNVATTEYRDTSVTAALMGSGSNSMTNLFGAEIYRNNFYFSILPRREHAQDSAFAIQYGVDMQDVEQTVDWSNFCSVFYAEDNFGNGYKNGWSGVKVPHKFVKHVTLNYNEPNAERFFADAENLFKSMMYPRASYKVNYANLSDSELYADFDILKKCNVGDRGFIFCDELGIRVDSSDPAQQVQVVRKVTDVLRAVTVSIELGSLVSSFVRGNTFSDIIAPAAVSKADGFFKLNKGGE